MALINRNNIRQTFIESNFSEKSEGYNYYHTQYSNLESFAKVSGYSVQKVIAAFAALSPNNAESTNYRALASCLAICLGKIPGDAPVIAFGSNKSKALILLKNERVTVEEVLRGPKTYAFYRNTLDPDNGQFVTIDGHMYNCWKGQVVRLQSIGADFRPTLYRHIKRDLVQVADSFNVSPARFQAILWLTWKRIHNILSSAQLPFESGYNLDRAKWMIDHAPESRTFCRSEGGKSLTEDTLSSLQTQSCMEFDEEPTHTEL